ncbi:MAG: hypothetical protein AAFP85_13600 [Pseudomonadota bacterium]
MAFADLVERDRSTNRSIGRRQEDRAMRGGAWAADRERRRPVMHTGAAAQSVLMACIADTPKACIRPDVTLAYAQANPQKSATERRREAFLREAELAHQAAQRAWVFERRTGQKPRSTNVEDAEFVDI